MKRCQSDCRRTWDDKGGIVQALYQQYLVAGPAGYVKDLFESMKIEEADKKAERF